MKRLIPVLLFCGLTNACAVVDMPGGEQTNPEWMDERVAQTESAGEAPASVPDQRLDARTELAIAFGIDQVLTDRDAMDGEAATLDAYTEPGGDDQLDAARDRAAPPE